MGDVAAAVIVAQISDEARRWLEQQHGGADSKRSTTEPKVLVVDCEYVVPVIVCAVVMRYVATAYHVDDQQYDKLAAHLQTSYTATGSCRRADRDDFFRPYIGGDVVRQLEAYITHCATSVAEAPERYPFPSISMVQSTGFGKSRLLCELARRTMDDANGRLKVLYTCVRPRNVVSTAYPEATVHLRDYLFPLLDPRRHVRTKEREDDLAKRLLRLYDYARIHWSTVGREWFQLFEDQADSALCQQIRDHKPEDGRSATVSNQRRTLVLAMDDARYLLPTEHGSSINWMHVLRRALRNVTPTIHTTFGRNAGILVILVDTNPKVANAGLLDRPGRVCRDQVDDDGVRFPPFVLTHTMDIQFDVLVAKAHERGLSRTQLYQESVAKAYDDAWSVLVSMGRPLWSRVQIESVQEREKPSATIQLAADLLLGGSPAWRPESFTEASLFGVASVLCRIGLHACSWSPLAARTVAHFMAVLTYVSTTQDQLLTTYASDPILTFGAVRVWYQAASSVDVHSVLVDCILPHLGRLLCQDLVDSGGRCDLVSRIVLLLAMDTTGVVAAPASATDSQSDCEQRQYAGELRSVKTFLEVLYGDYPLTVVDEWRKPGTDCPSKVPVKRATATTGVTEMLKALSDWKLGFSHFVQVSTMPTKGMLWSMLARRAAGIFLRNDKGVDLFLPMVNGETVSMVVVQVYDHAANGFSVPDVASMTTRPSFVDQFKPQGLSHVVGICMRLRGGPATVRDQFYLVDTGTRDRHGPTSAESYVLCLDGLGPWTATRETITATADRLTVPVVSTRLALELQKLLEPWWTVTELVHDNVERRANRFGMDQDALFDIASRPLVDSLLRASDEAGVQEADGSVLGV